MNGIFLVIFLHPGREEEVGFVSVLPELGRQRLQVGLVARERRGVEELDSLELLQDLGQVWSGGVRPDAAVGCSHLRDLDLEDLGPVWLVGHRIWNRNQYLSKKKTIDESV